MVPPTKNRVVIHLGGHMKIVLLGTFFFCSFAAAFSPQNWTVSTSTYQHMNLVYTPFFVGQDAITFYSSGPGVNPGNAVRELQSNLAGTTGFTGKVVIPHGPDLKDLNYFRGLRIAKSGSEMWAIAETARCYTGCDPVGNIRRQAIYRSQNAGQTWTFQGLMSVDGAPHVAAWRAHTGLVFNPKGDAKVNLKDLTKNRFVTNGEKINGVSRIFVSANGVDFFSAEIKHDFPDDNFVFASLAQTPFGYHMMAGANWTDAAGVQIVRHLFSRDLVRWTTLESQTILKNKNFYKGVHLSYDSARNKLWAFSPCGSVNACGILAHLEPRNFLQ